jgi:P-type E1-E2 ATPase
MIPISLYVALELVKISQGILIYYDNEIYDITINKPTICRATDLIEELGQVEFIFSDKTGTLTQNDMVLRP